MLIPQMYSSSVVMPQAPPASSTGEALVLGLAYGVLHAIGPDHLGTVIALSVAAKSPAHAFSVGASWSLGHCAGMCVVAALIMGMERLVAVDMEAWEHFGDYIIGFSMLACGLYFLVREHDYLDVKSDGSVSLKGCSCHGHSHQHVSGEEDDLCPPCAPPEFHSPPQAFQGRTRSAKRLARSSKPTFAASFGQCQEVGCDHAGHDHMKADNEAAEQDPLLPCTEASTVQLDSSKLSMDRRSCSTGDMRSALLGALQGMCCPMGLVGIALLASLSPLGIAVFVMVFLVVSAVGVGGIACLWSHFASRSSTSGALSQKTMYRVSCGFTVLLGTIWIAANFCGVLDQLNYAEGAHGVHEPALVAVTIEFPDLPY